MLYERWRQISRANRNELALHEFSSDRHWTFSELAAAAESGVDSSEPIVFPKGSGADFVFDVLCGWRKNQIVCPLEPGQERVGMNAFPPGCVHLKVTSATTGTPRVIAFTAPQLIADGENIVATMGLRPDWPNLGLISLAHSYGFSNLILPLLLHGVPLLLGDSNLPEAVQRATARTDALTLPAVPALWRAWHEANALDLKVRLAISAGAPLPLLLEHDVFAKSRLKIHNFYGASECGGIAYDRTNMPRQDAACVGSPLENVQLTVNDSGALGVSSAAVGETYWPEADSRLGNGRFLTDDLAELNDGFVFLRGRSSDQINMAGRKVSPETIEAALQLHPCVRECVVFGVPAEESGRGEKIVACVVVLEQAPLDLLKQFLVDRLPAWQVPREWWTVEAIPTNPRGKLSRSQWRERYLELQQQSYWTGRDFGAALGAFSLRGSNSKPIFPPSATTR